LFGIPNIFLNVIFIYRLTSIKPGVYKLITQFQHIQNEIERSIKQLIQNRFSKKFNESKQQREERIKNLVLSCKNNADNADFNILEFLRELLIIYLFKTFFF